MQIHEYQAKSLLSKFGVPLARGGLATNAAEAAYRATEIGGNAWVVKAQIHSGARGKAGGIKICGSDKDVYDAASSLLGSTLITNQTGPEGKRCTRLYIEQASDIEREIYLAFVLDRSQERIAVIASKEGGMDIEELAEKCPESIIKLFVEPAVGLQAFECRELAFALDIPANLISQAVQTIQGCYRAMRDSDATMVEINPLVITRNEGVLALDAKMEFDDNAGFRQPHVHELRDREQEDNRETMASDLGLSYVGLSGDIGCIINGAGLAMATMDMIKHVGGEPANFLDIGGGASPQRVTSAFDLVRSDSNVKVILVNIFAGINRCDWIAEGVVSAMQTLQLELPVVVRLSGTNVAEGRDILKQSGLALAMPTTLMSAAEMAVAALHDAT